MIISNNHFFCLLNCKNFQHSKELSTSPENTFSNANTSRKESMSTNLLDNDSIFANGKSKAVDKVGTIERYKSLDCSDTIAEYHMNGIDAIVCETRIENGNEVPAIRESCESETKCDSIDDRDRPCLEDELAMKENYSNSRKAGGYLIAVHRKLSRQDTYFLSYHKTRPSLFGVPLLIPCYENGTNKDLYCAVWIQVARLLSPLPSTPPDQSNHATDWYV